MQRFTLSAVAFCLGSAVTTGVLSTPAFATNYNFYTLEDGHESYAYGITDSGIAVIRNPGACTDFGPDPCYTEFVNGHETSSFATVPDLPYVNGKACTVDGVKALCNGAYDAFLSPDFPEELYAGVAGSEVLLPNSYGTDFRDVYLNSSGDVLYSSGSTDESYEAITTTPEPSTLMLLGSGALGAAAAVRRRVFAR